MSNEMRDLALNMIADVDSYEAEEIIDLLSAADNLYHNGNDNQSFLEDNEYDALRSIAERLDPSNVYFTGVGSDVRGGKIKLPFEMGSLDQVEIGDIADWIGNWMLQDEEIVATDKMDGTSTLLVYGSDGLPQIAYSRGNGTEGADISRHIFKIKNVPKKVSGKMNVRAEVELTETAFEFLRDKVKRHSSNEPYKNARNMVAGLMNRKENPAIVYEHLTVVAYEIVGADMSKLDMLETIEKEGFQCVEYKTWYGENITDAVLTEYLNKRRKELDYAIDGLVLDVERKEKRNEMNPSRDTLNPAYSIKYKVADESNLAIATVSGVTWNLSKHGYWKPQVNLEPVELVGVVIRNATGFNAAFIFNNKIGKGAKVQLTRSGDVIPFIQKVVTGAAVEMPEGDWYWTVNNKGENVDAVLNNHHENDEVKIQQAIDFFASIDAPHIKEGNVRKLVPFTGGDIIGDIIRMSKNELIGIIGENGGKVYDGLHTKLQNIPAYVLLGSVPFFGRGVGKRKFKKLLTVLLIEDIRELSYVNVSQICSVDGFEDKTAKKIVSGVGPFLKWFESVSVFIAVAKEKPATVPTDGSMVGQKIVFTGFRDAELQSKVETAGGEMQSAVSSKTTMLVTKDPKSNSGKVQKAREKGVRIVGVDELRGML